MVGTWRTELRQEITDYQNRYDEKTNHSINETEQEIYNRKIADDLNTFS